MAGTELGKKFIRLTNAADKLVADLLRDGANLARVLKELRGMRDEKKDDKKEG